MCRLSGTFSNYGEVAKLGKIYTVKGNSIYRTTPSTRKSDWPIWEPSVRTKNLYLDLKRN